MKHERVVLSLQKSHLVVLAERLLAVFRIMERVLAVVHQGYKLNQRPLGRLW